VDSIVLGFGKPVDPQRMLESELTTTQATTVEFTLTAGLKISPVQLIPTMDSSRRPLLFFIIGITVSFLMSLISHTGNGHKVL